MATLQPLWNLYTVLIFVTARRRQGNTWNMKALTFLKYLWECFQLPERGVVLWLENQNRLRSVWHFSADDSKPNWPACGSERVRKSFVCHPVFVNKRQNKWTAFTREHGRSIYHSLELINELMQYRHMHKNKFTWTERGGSVVTHKTRIREVPGSNPMAGQPGWGF